MTKTDTTKAGNGGESRQLVTARDRAMSLRTMLEQRKSELAAALPRHLTADRMLRLTLTACTRNPRLLECTPASVYGAVLQSAQLGLEPDLLGQAYLVPFRNTKKGITECQLIPGYKGLLALARRSNEIASIQARVVREGDLFKYEYGLKEKLVHRPRPEADAEMTHVYAIARFKHRGDPQWEVMTRDQVEMHRKRSRAANDGPWVTDYEAMSMKTVLRVLCKLLPASVELQTAVELDERAEVGLPQDLPVLPPAEDEAQPPARQKPKKVESQPDETKPSHENSLADDASPDGLSTEDAQRLWDELDQTHPREPGEEG